MCSLTIVSCQQDETEALLTNASEDVSSPFELVQITPDGEIIPIDEVMTRSDIKGEIALSFESEIAYNKALEDLEKLSREKRLDFTNSLGFISLQKLCDIADEELEMIDSISVGVEDFLERYNAYVKKYEGQLVRNPYDDTDMSLYIPDDSEMTTYLINSNRNVVIGKNIRRAPIIDVDDSQYIVSSDYSNGHQTYQWQSIYNKSKKTTVSITFETGGNVMMKVGCQKHITLGWKRDTKRIIFAYLSDGNYPIHLEYDHLIADPTCYLAGTGTGKIDYMKIGEINGTGVSGNLYVWTDQTIDPDLGFQWVKVYSQEDNETYYANFPIINVNNALGGSYHVYL